MIVKVLGSGCSNCTKLLELVKQAVVELGVETEIIKVEDMKSIVQYGVMKTPALVVNDKVKIMGRVPAYKEVLTLLKETI